MWISKGRCRGRTMKLIDIDIINSLQEAIKDLGNDIKEIKEKQNKMERKIEELSKEINFEVDNDFQFDSELD